MRAVLPQSKEDDDDEEDDDEATQSDVHGYCSSLGKGCRGDSSPTTLRPLFSEIELKIRVYGAGRGAAALGVFMDRDQLSRRRQRLT